MTRNAPVDFGLLAAIALLGVHCSTGGAGAVVDRGGDAATAADGADKLSDRGCPIDPPTPGTSCDLPNGTDCTSHYPHLGCMCCGFTRFECRAGQWVASDIPTDPDCARGQPASDAGSDAGSDAATDGPVDAADG